MSESTTELKTLLRTAENNTRTAQSALKDMKAKRLGLTFWAAAAGFMLFAVGGQWFPGYQLDSTAEAAAQDRADAAVGEVMAQLCVERFMNATGLETRLADMDRAPSDWGKSKFVREGAWAVLPDGEQPDHATADKCRGLIVDRVSETTAQAS